MKKIKVSETELLAVVYNTFSELKTVFAALPDRNKNIPRRKRLILDELYLLLSTDYGMDLTSDDLYDTFFKLERNNPTA